MQVYCGLSFSAYVGVWDLVPDPPAEHEKLVIILICVLDIFTNHLVARLVVARFFAYQEQVFVYVHGRIKQSSDLPVGVSEAL